ncbi:MAG: polysaccharide pyruvyl transferase family protein, partial [Enterobacteriaceae bacterium]
MIDGSSGVNGSFMRLEAIEIAAKIGARVYLFFSYRSDVDSRIVSRLNELIQYPSIYFCLRDEKSLDTFKQAYPGSHCQFFPDLAFYAYDLKEFARTQKKKVRLSIGVNFSEQSFRATQVEFTDANRRKYISDYLNEIVKQFPDGDYIIFPNDIRMWDNFWSDFDYAVACQSLLDDLDLNGRVTLINPVANYREIIECLHNIDLLFSCRMHLAIASFIAGTLPVVITAKSFKSEEDLKQRGMYDKARGMLDWCFGRPDFVVTNKNELRQLLKTIAIDISGLQASINRKNHYIKEQILKFTLPSWPIKNRLAAVMPGHSGKSSLIISSLKSERFKLEIDCRNYLKELEIRGKWAKHLESNLNQAEEQLYTLNQVVFQQNKQISTLNQAVSQQDKQLSGLKKALSLRDEQLSGLNKALSQQDEQISSLNQVISQQKTQISNLNQIVFRQDTQISSLNQDITERDTEINAIHTSYLWKTMTLLKKISKRDHHINSMSEPGTFFTICSKNFLAHARALYDSLRPHYPNTMFFVVLCDRVDGFFDPAQEPFEFVFLEDLNLPDLGKMAQRYNITELNTAVKPFAFLHLMRKFKIDSVVYLDPDLFFVDKMPELEQLLAQGAEAVLTPHLLQPAEHDQINDNKMLLYGIYNLGFLALRNTPTVNAFLEWWGRRLEHHCIIRLEEGLFVDQKWADLLPAFVPGTRILQHPGYNVAYWNLPQRKITRHADRWFANNQPLRFVHFSGNQLDDTRVFSRHSQQVTIDNIGVLRELLDAYRQEVYQQNHTFYRSLPYAYSWDGETGINLHTPKALDMASNEILSPEAGGKVTPQHPHLFAKFQRRLAVVSQAIPTAKGLSGGWTPFLRRVWNAYQRHGWHYIKLKALEISQLQPPPETSVWQPTDQSHQEHRHSRRLLYLDWAIPKPDQDAASVTAILLLEILHSLGYQVTFIPCSLKYEEGYYEALVTADIQVIVYPTIHSIKEWLQSHGHEFSVCVMARGPVVWPYLETLKQFTPNIKLIFNTVDLHYLRELRQAELEKNEQVRRNALVLQAQELELIDRCDLSILLSQEELYII